MVKEKKTKSGFVVLVGRSNVGKSTLLNNLVGTKIAITTPKSQTTRFPIRGIIHDPRGQAVLVDTPGVFEKSFDQLTESLNKRVKETLKGIDLILHIVDPSREIGNEEKIIQRLIKYIKVAKILVINKVDLSPLPFLEDYRRMKENYDDSVEISALKRKHLKKLLDLIFKYLPQKEPFYPEYQFTDLDQKAWLEELIREKVFLYLHEEIPYSTTVEIEEIQEKKENLLYIKAKIITDNPRHKIIIIGKGGQKIKEIGKAARKEMEAVFNKKIFLDLEVEVEKWKNRF